MVLGVIGGRSKSRPRVPGVSCKVELVRVSQIYKVEVVLLLVGV